MQESTTPKEKLLKKIRKALIEKTDNPYPKLDETSIFSLDDEIPEVRFAQEFTKVNGQFLFCENEIHFIEHLIGFAEEKKWQKIFCWDTALQELLRKYEFPFITTDLNFEKADVGALPAPSTCGCKASLFSPEFGSICSAIWFWLITASNLALLVLLFKQKTV